MLKRTIAVLGIALFPLMAFAQQGAVITGTVTDAETGDLLIGANVNISSLGIGDASGVDGIYRIVASASAAQGQDAEITVNFIGYSPITATISLTAGDHTQDFALSRDVLGLNEVIVTGVVGATPLTKVPFAVGRLNASDLPVTASSAESAIRGKIAGVKVIKGSGRPGTAASVQLRGATSVNASGRSQEPLYIVDGVILGGTMADIDARDIESIEVVKGAAGASLYGSRAAQGVVSIKTSRGKGLALGQTKVTFRSESGNNELTKGIDLVSYHTYKLAETSYTDANGYSVAAGDFIDSDGDFVDPRDPLGARATDWWKDSNGDVVSGIRFQDNAYKWVSTGVPSVDAAGIPDPSGIKPTLLPSGGFDNIDKFYIPGQYQTSTISVARNSATTNFFASFVNSQEPGVLYKLEGNTRNSLRVNLDHSLRETLRLSVSTYFSQTSIDDISEGGAFFDLTFMPPDVDLLMIDETDWEREELGNRWEDKSANPELFVRPDPTNVEEANPLYELVYLDRQRNRTRFSTNASLNYRPFDWFSLETNLSLDQQEQLFQFYAPKGYKTVTSSNWNTGRMQRSHSASEAINADATASFYQSVGALNLRMKLRYLFEQNTGSGTGATGLDFAVGGTPTLNAAGSQTISSSNTKVLGEGYYFIGGIDFADKYIIDVLTRRDGSSLFGEDERWQNYYRFSGAYRISEEPFWVLKGMINEFKIRFSQGTAGSRPAFAAQYETYGLSNGNLSGQATLGNMALKPEFAKETEMGIDFAVMDKFYIQITKASAVIEDQIDLVPLSGTFGVPAQWQNIGTLESDVLELSVQASVLSTSALSLDLGFVYDAMTQTMTELNVPAYKWSGVFYNKEGEELGSLYGDRWATAVSDLPADITGTRAGEFDVNDDGYVVWVGSGNSWKDGMADNWGTSDTSGTYNWGMPIAQLNEEGGTFMKMGNTIPDFNYGFTGNLRLGNLSFYALIEGQSGGDIYNQTSQWGMRDNKVAQVDQAGKAESEKKPTAYYQVLYNVNKGNSHFVEDGSYMKLQELSIRYSLSLPTFTNQVTLGIIGRNLITWTNYTGYDPEVGQSGGNGGSAVLDRRDNYDYPNFRSVAFILEVGI